MMKDETQTKRVQALITLIDDPDYSIYEQIRDEILELNPDAVISKLQSAFDITDDETLKSRLAELLVTGYAKIQQANR